MATTPPFLSDVFSSLLTPFFTTDDMATSTVEPSVDVPTFPVDIPSVGEVDPPNPTSATPEHPGEPTQSEDPDGPETVPDSDSVVDGELPIPAVAEGRLQVATLDVSGFQKTAQTPETAQPPEILPNGSADAIDVTSAVSVGGGVASESVGVTEIQNDSGAEDKQFPVPGADQSTPVEALDASQQAVIDAIVTLDADILGMTGLVNDGYAEASTLQALVDALNAYLGESIYAAITLDRPQLGSQSTTVGVLYKASAVKPLGDAAVLETGVFLQEVEQVEQIADPVDGPPVQTDIGNSSIVKSADGDSDADSDSERAEPIGEPLYQQVPLAQSFEEVATGEVFTLVVTDFSQGDGDQSSEGSEADEPIQASEDGTNPPMPDSSDTAVSPGDLGDGVDSAQNQAAQALADWLATNPTQVWDSDVLIVGSTGVETPSGLTETLEQSGYTSLAPKTDQSASPDNPVDGSSPEIKPSDFAFSNTSFTEQVSSVGGQPFDLGDVEPGVGDADADMLDSELADLDSPGYEDSGIIPEEGGVNQRASVTGVPMSGDSAVDNASLGDSPIAGDGSSAPTQPDQDASVDEIILGDSLVDGDNSSTPVQPDQDTSVDEVIPGDSILDGDDSNAPVQPDQDKSIIVGLTLARSTLEGTTGRDSLMGTAADEVFIGGTGADFITTGGGYDTLVYLTARDGSDRVYDFDPSQDRIALTELFQVSNIAASTYTDAISLGYLSVEERGDDTWLRFDPRGNGLGRTFAILEGVSTASLSDRNFIF